MESRRLYRRGDGALRRLPHPAQSHPGDGPPQEVHGRDRRRLEGLQHHPRQGDRHRRLERRDAGAVSSTPAMSKATARPRVRWAKRSTTASAISSPRTSTRWSVYLRTVPPISDPALPAPKTAPASASPKDGYAEADAQGADLFAGACASCHGWTGQSPVLALGHLHRRARRSTIPAPATWPRRSSGATRETPSGAAAMPAFGHAYSDSEIASPRQLRTKRFGAAPSGLPPRRWRRSG